VKVKVKEAFEINKDKVMLKKKKKVGSRNERKLKERKYERMYTG
jgi:hypothetical protein